MNSHHVHISEDDLVRFQMGRSQEQEERLMVERHLVGCQWCRDRMAAFERFINLARAGKIRKGRERGAVHD